MKKSILLLIILFMLCGCELKYKITITDDTIYDEIRLYEKTEIVNEQDEETIEEFNDELQYWEIDYNYYIRKDFKEKDVTGYIYTSEFNYEEYNLLSEISRCYKQFEIKNNDYIEINTSDTFLCLNENKNIDNITIIIESDYKVVESNADKVKDNQLTWTINSTNYKKKPIKVKLDKNNIEEKKDSFDIKKIIIIIIFVGLIIINLTILKKDKRQGAN